YVLKAPLAGAFFRMQYWQPAKRATVWQPPSHAASLNHNLSLHLFCIFPGLSSRYLRGSYIEMISASGPDNSR
ncbi:hypothetical protein, partial [Klebsiella pneumoniae]|uniref:hypothetical protein n=1 Tax=Klebsiella pneumoniae TaxID=573 RepID=UPI001C9AEA4D